MNKCTSTPGCPGDGAFASPGKGHWDICQHPKPYDGDPEVLEFRATAPVTDAIAPAMTLVYLFGAAVRDATPEQMAALPGAKALLEERRPFAEIGQRILEIMGPMWVPDPKTMQAIEALHAPKEEPQ